MGMHINDGGYAWQPTLHILLFVISNYYAVCTIRSDYANYLLGVPSKQEGAATDP